MRGKDHPDAPRAQRRRATRNALLEAAHELVRRGEDPLDPSAVAARVGVSRPLFYRYFPTREAFADALLGSLHEEGGDEPAPAAGQDPADPIQAFFEGLAAPLDRNAELARVLIPRSHRPGAVSTARAARRKAAVARVAGLLPPSLPARRRRAAFLMDAFLGLQWAWSRGADGSSLTARVRSEMPWAIRGVLGRGAPAPSHVHET